MCDFECMRGRLSLLGVATLSVFEKRLRGRVALLHGNLTTTPSIT